MWTATDEFFERLGQAAHDPRLRSVRGTARFEISDGESTQHWHVAVLHGDVVVSRDDEAADAVFRSSRELFDQIVMGEANVMSAVLRGAVTYQGDPQFGVVFRRLFGTAAPMADDLGAAAKEQS